MTRVRVLLWFLALCVAPAFATAQEDEADGFVSMQMRRQNIPGLSLVVLRHGEIIKVAGYGFADLQQKAPATPETVYKIASVSKQFVAAGIMLLVQDGRLALSDPVGSYLDDAPPTWSGITVGHLLAHTSGLVREAPGFNALKVQDDADLIRTAYPVALRNARGEKWEYSNLGYFALAEIISRVAGKPWTEYMAERIFDPLGMNATHPTNTTAVVPNRAQGYVDNDELRVAREWPAFRPSGAFLSNALDLARWDAALYTDRILSDSIRRLMWMPATLNDGTTAPYGLGWRIGTVNGFRLVHHSGGMPGTRSSIARFVDQGLTIIVLMNLDDVDIDTIVHGLADIYLPAEPPGGLHHQ